MLDLMTLLPPAAIVVTSAALAIGVRLGQRSERQRLKDNALAGTSFFLGDDRELWHMVDSETYLDLLTARNRCKRLDDKWSIGETQVVIGAGTWPQFWDDEDVMKGTQQ